MEAITKTPFPYDKDFEADVLAFITRHKFKYAAGAVIKHVTQFHERACIRDLFTAKKYINRLIDDAKATESATNASDK